MIIVVFLRPFRLSVEMKVILNYDSSTPLPSVKARKLIPNATLRLIAAYFFPLFEQFA